MHSEIAKQRVIETVEYLTRRLAGLPIATVGTITDLTLKWLSQEQPAVLKTLGEQVVRALVEKECA